MNHNSPAAAELHDTPVAPSRRDIVGAWNRIRHQLGPSPLVPSRGIHPELLLKLETLQPTGSFKVRGAFAALSRLAPGERVVTASAGNHGLGVAFAAAHFGIDATVVIPETASTAKRDALARFPITLVDHGRIYDDAEQHAIMLADDVGERYVSPYNDLDVIAGQGTLALELLRALRPPVTILCPIGGGGLAAGVGLYAASIPGVRVVGVESTASAAMRASLDAGRITEIDVQATLADGLGGNLEPESVTFDLCRQHLADVVTVTEAEIEEAIRSLARTHGLVVEGAGAVAVAAVLAGRVEIVGRPVALVTGRNISPEAFARLVA